ncbi:hypothetical protein P8452_62577 [Trifolium repens]|nr:hypothetical protein P8452_62577 [Trifolium repens]
MSRLPYLSTDQFHLLVGKMVHMEKSKVEIQFDDVVDILPGKEDFRIRVRVVHLWKVPAFLNPSESSSLEMVLVVEKSLM